MDRKVKEQAASPFADAAVVGEGRLWSIAFFAPPPVKSHGCV
jgi:hypothetical protein